MIVTVSDASPRQARGHIGDVWVKWKHVLKDVTDVSDQTGTVRGCIERVEMSLKLGFHVIIKPGFHMIVTVGDLLRHIGDVSPISQRHMETIAVTIIWKPGFKLISTLSMRPRTVPV